MTIRFYGKSNIKYWPFSNFYHAVINVDGIEWSDNEHFFQASKFMKTDPAYAEQIRLTPRPRIAFYLGQNQDGLYIKHPQWEIFKDDVMRFVVGIKVVQHSHIASLLDSTDEHYIVEASPFDNYFGEGRNRKGCNMLGQIWMEVRSRVRHDTLEKYITQAQERVEILSELS